MLAGEATFRLSAVPMCVADAAGRITAINAAFEARFGALGERALPSLLIVDRERTQAEVALRTVFQTDDRVVYRGLCSVDGAPRTYAWSCRAIEGEILAEADDITSRLAAETELDALLRAIPDIYFRLDHDGRIVAFHAAREAEFAIPSERFIGHRAQDMLPPPAAEVIGSAVERVLALRVPVQIEYTLPTPSGDDQFEAYVVPCGEHDATTIIRNTTARRRAEAALRASEERLLATQKLDAIGQLAGGVAHDFNNLLGVILGRLGFLKRAAGLGDIDRDHVQEALDAASHAANLTRQLLAFGRRQPMKPTAFDLNAVVASMHEMLARMLGEDVTLDFTLLGEPCAIISDPVQIEQVILNLALNARHAMPDGGKLVVTTKLGSGDGGAGFVVLAVTDGGCGMSTEVMAHLFEPFFTTKPRDEGTGLGLATVYGIVKQSGGHVDVQSEVGRGSTFELFFPIADGESLPHSDGAHPQLRYPSSYPAIDRPHWR